jgi:lipoprotein NlpD
MLRLMLRDTAAQPSLLRVARRFVHLSLLALVLAACASRAPAPIEDRSRGGTARPEQRYTVLRGDTLYSIAFRYGLDFRRLAAANGIEAPFTIVPGQRLELREADPPLVARASSPKGSRPAVTSGTAPTPSKPSTPSKPPAKATVPAQAQAQTVPAPGPAPVRPKPPLADAGNTRVDSWRWPASGRVIRGFDAATHKGIDLAGARGDTVRAAAGGRVVYAGSGIAGYGLLLILRHNDEYLTAYGHNDELLVAEGDTVRAGAAIARRGSSGTDSVKLHFEIRRNGKPIDPLRLLPSR